MTLQMVLVAPYNGIAGPHAEWVVALEHDAEKSARVFGVMLSRVGIDHDVFGSIGSKEVGVATLRGTCWE